ncbi:glycosyl hydrolase family 31 protein [Paraphaeosphaeria minitans]|uniref:Glycosyl hydrolase family 31 protein n=1 Tax=Paraphaeosphaeria minitans TaxID=565426 RepID=A0A9P6KLQ5_9PLEO|nr:glycosyl hydrolase family 31 protein [Paraphaeosphaeria minitans]
MLSRGKDRLVFKYDAEQIWIEPWGSNALRVRATKMASISNEDWALLKTERLNPTIEIGESSGMISNGNIKATITKRGKLTISNENGKTLLEEYTRHRHDVIDPKCSALEVEAREFKPIIGGNYHLTARFESLDPKEKIFGMGQYQQPFLDVKGTQLELAHRNSQASVPFAVSSRGYGFLWNNPSIGNAIFGKNIMSFEAQSTQALDYWVVAGDTPARIVESYANGTGKVPMMPEYGLGFWQCKLRYQSQEELLEVAREYKRRELPIDLIVIDFFHWPFQGDWRFDETYWPDPDAMIKELKSLDIELMVSIWPTVDKRSENFEEMLEKGYLIRTERGGLENTSGRKLRQNYFSRGIKVFWLDEAEPEYRVYDFENYRYHLGPNVAIGNIFPVEYARAFYEGQSKEGQQNIVNLIRCAWAGSQKYGALVWSGDIASSWSTLRNQLAAGLNMGMSGLPWWTTDIGVGYVLPVMRLHGDREPRQQKVGSTGGASCRSGADNEVWSYRPEVYEICKKYMRIRENLRAYTRKLMAEAHEKGSPVMRSVLYEFPEDSVCWEIEEQYMFGDKYLCCPVLEAGQDTMTVYLPRANGGSRWKSIWGTDEWEGGTTIDVACPLGTMPIFERL